MTRRRPALRVVLVTAPPRRARFIALALVGRRLAACANLVPGVRSIYRWKGRVEEANETLLVLKTTAARLPDLYAALPGLHPYEVPEGIALPVGEALGSYAAWVEEETRRPARRATRRR